MTLLRLGSLSSPSPLLSHQLDLFVILDLFEKFQKW